MRVALVTTSFPLHRGSTSGTFIADLAQALAAHVELTVIAPCDDRPEPPTSPGNFALRCFGYAPRRWRVLAHGAGGVPQALARRPWLYALVPVLLIALFFAVRRAARKSDIVHANWSITGVVAALAARTAGKPALVTLRGSDVARAHTSWLYRRLLRACVRLNSRIITVSDDLMHRTLALAPRAQHRIVVIPNGVAANFFAIKRGDARTPLRAIVVANLIPDKGVEVAIRALADCADVELRIVGAGPEDERLRTLAQSLALSSRVHFLGAVPHAHMPALLADAEVFILTSYHEGRSNALLEAMAAGCAVVAGAIPGIDEVVAADVSGLLFAPGDARALAAQLQKLRDTPALCSALGTAARNTLLARGWRWSDTAARYVEAYRQVAGAATH